MENNPFGIALANGTVTLRDNTIINNNVGIALYSPNAATTINYNNIFSNSQNIVLEPNTPSNYNATYNWWGTTDTNAINQTIFDSKDNFNLGTVTFVPFLTASNSQATPNPNDVPPTPSQSTPTNPQFTLNPTSGPVGATVLITGTGYSPNEPATFIVGGNEMFAPAITADANGNINGNTTVPYLATGTYQIVSYDASGKTASANFVVTNGTSQTPAPHYTITITHVGSGTVSPTDGQYSINASLTLTATPASNYAFMCWLQNGTLLSSSNPYNYATTNNYVITAVFYDPSSKASATPTPTPASSSSGSGDNNASPTPTSSVSVNPTATATTNPTSTPLSTPSVPELTLLSIVPLLAIALFVAIQQRRRKINQPQQTGSQ